MVTITYVDHDGTETCVQAEVGDTLMHAAVSNGISGIVGECGGGAMCGTCHLYVRDDAQEDFPPVGDVEDDLLFGAASPRTSESRLGCRVPITESMDGLRVTMPESQY